VTAEREGWSGGVRRRLILIAVFALPFTLALTLDLKFPLKIYELALLATGLTCFSQFRIPTLRSASQAAIWIILLIVWAVAVLLWHLWVPPPGLSASGFASRFGPLGDGIAKILYLLLSLFGFLQVAERTYREEARVLRWWVAGAVVAALYAWYLFGTTLFGAAPYLLPGIDSPQFYSFDRFSVIRSGTFEEGNFLGLFLIVSTMIALYARYRLASLFLAASVLISFSTVNFVALTLIAALLIWRGPAQMGAGRKLATIAAGLTALLGIAALLIASGYVDSVLADKLLGQSLISRIDRVVTALTGLQMFRDHPITGVGLSQYGYYYNTYEVTNLLNMFHYEKRIANNVYVELLSELGIIGFALFAAYLTRVWVQLRHRELLPLQLGFLAVLLVWNAFPSYSIMFLWAFWGVIFGASARLADRRPYVATASANQLAGIH
jgi:O-antigen ligase